MKFKSIIHLFLTFLFLLILTSCNNSNESTQVENGFFEFSLEDNNTYSIKKVDETAEGKIIIPEQYKGLAITKIQSSAFANCTSVKEISVPNSVVEIGYAAFSG